MTGDSTNECQFSFTHKKGSRHTHLGSAAACPPIELGSVPPYNRGSKSKSFRVTVARPKSPLSPLSTGSIVKLFMDTTVVVGYGKKRTAKQKRELVIVTPGKLFGASIYFLLVSVVGKGCAVIDLRDGRSIAKLMLAGMPKEAASILMAESHRVLTENVA